LNNKLKDSVKNIIKYKMVEPGAIVFIVFGSVGFAFVCYILVDKLIKNQMNRRLNIVAVEPDTGNEDEKEEEYEDETKEEYEDENEEIRGSNFV
jgi:hypothetical protein